MKKTNIEWSRLIADEQGKPSTARCAFWIVLIWTILLMTLAAAGIFTVSSAAYALLGTIFTFTIVWAAGPRMAEYLAPQIGRAITSIAKAKGDSRLPNIRKDDERGD